jgi:hypothetical protein
VTAAARGGAPVVARCAGAVIAYCMARACAAPTCIDAVVAVAGRGWCR